MAAEDLLVATNDWPPDLGGMSEYARGLVGGLRDLGANVHVRVTQRAGTPARRAARLAPLLFADGVRRHPSRVLALHWSPAGLAAWAMRHTLGTPYEVVTYGLDVTEPQRSPRARRWMKRVLTDADRVWSISRYTRDQILAFGIDPEKTGLLHPGVDWQRFVAPDPERTERLRRRFGLDGRRVLLSVGRLVRRKGHDLVIRCLPELPEDVVYLIVGDGPERERILALAEELGVSDRVIRTGVLSDADVGAAYPLGTVFVMPTRELEEERDVEGFGIVYLEANAAGLPVVAAASGGAVDAVVDEETGLLVPPGDLGALTQALRRLFEDPELARRLAAAGKRRACQEFDWKNIASRLLEQVGGQDG